MSFYPASIVLLALWCWITLRRPEDGLVLAVAVIPFGMFAALEVGGLSLRASHLIACFSIFAIALKFISDPSGLQGLSVSKAGLALVAFAIYGAISATFLVRVFAGAFDVFPVALDVQGPATSIHFFSAMGPIEPSSSNVSQLGYVLISCAFFLFLESSVRRNGLTWLERGLVAAGIANGVLGILDFFEADKLLAVVRTADYALLNQHVVAGLPRLIGGFSEPAAFAAISAAIGGYFTVSFITDRSALHGGLALVNLGCALLAFSASGYMAIAVAILLVFFITPRLLASGVPRRFAHTSAAFLCLVLAVLIAAVMLTPVADTLVEVGNVVFVSKLSSVSGIERSAWALSGLEMSISTYGLGAGIGSLRSNGMLPVMLGSVGLPGTILFGLFLWYSIGRSQRGDCEHTSKREFLCAKVAAITVLSSLMLTATVPDPDLLLMTFAALATTSRQISFGSSYPQATIAAAYKKRRISSGAP